MRACFTTNVPLHRELVHYRFILWHFSCICVKLLFIFFVFAIVIWVYKVNTCSTHFEPFFTVLKFDNCGYITCFGSPLVESHWGGSAGLSMQGKKAGFVFCQKEEKKYKNVIVQSVCCGYFRLLRVQKLNAASQSNCDGMRVLLVLKGSSLGDKNSMYISLP